MSAEVHPAVEFVHAFHADLTDWFAGNRERGSVYERLVRSLHTEMVLVYPSGNRMLGGEFLASIAERYGSSPLFVASISNIELIRGDEDHAVVAYVETQTGARDSQSENQRSALALIVRCADGWCWRFIQETGLPD